MLPHGPQRRSLGCCTRAVSKPLPMHWQAGEDSRHGMRVSGDLTTVCRGRRRRPCSSLPPRGSFIGGKALLSAMHCGYLDRILLLPSAGSSATIWLGTTRHVLELVPENSTLGNATVRSGDACYDCRSCLRPGNTMGNLWIGSRRDGMWRLTSKVFRAGILGTTCRMMTSKLVPRR